MDGHCIDFIITRCSDSLFKSVTVLVLPRVISDHHSVLSDILCHHQQKQNEVVSYRKLRGINTTELHWMWRTPLLKCLLNVRTHWTFFVETMNTILNKHAPSLTKQKTVQNSKP